MPKLETKDLFRIAYLIAEGFSLAETRLDESHRVTFILQGSGLVEADSLYRTGQALINPLHFRDSLNYLRDIIRETQKPNIRNVGLHIRSNHGKSRKIRGNVETLSNHGSVL